MIRDFSSETLDMKLSSMGALALSVIFLSLGTAPAQFVNGGFESGPANSAPPAPWIITTYTNSTGMSIVPPQTEDQLQLSAGGVAKTIILSNAITLSQPDADLGAAATLRWPLFDRQSVVVNSQGINRNVNALSQTIQIGPECLDPLDGQLHVRFAFAPVMHDAGHPAQLSPYYFLQLSNVTRQTILYQSFAAVNQGGIPWRNATNGLGTTFVYTDWQLADIVPGKGRLALGDTVTLKILAAGCQSGGHYAEVYVDGVGGVPPCPFVTGTAMQMGTSSSVDIVYTLTYRNGSTNAVSPVSVEFTTPAYTFFSSVNAPGLPVTTPAVGSTGTVTCTVGSLPAGAVGSFTVTVHTFFANSTISFVANAYDIVSPVTGRLIGPPIVPIIRPFVLSGPTETGNPNLVFSFTNAPGVNFTVLTATNVALPITNWAALGSPYETTTGVFRLSAPIPTNGAPSFYRLSSP